MAFVVPGTINVKIWLLISKLDLATLENQLHFCTHSLSIYKMKAYSTDINQTLKWPVLYHCLRVFVQFD